MRMVFASIALLHAVFAAGQPQLAVTATTIEAIRNYPYFFRGRPVTVIGTVSRDGDRLSVRSDTGTLDLESDKSIAEGRRELRGLMTRNLTLRVTEATTPGLVAEAVTPPLRAVVMEPAAYVGQTITVVGQFRGRNLFADLPENPIGRGDFVLRAGDAAVWVTGILPRVKDVSLNPSRRQDAGQWLAITGLVRYGRGLVWLEAAAIALAPPPETTAAVAVTVPVPPPVPLEVFFSAPVRGEADVPVDTRIRIQFSDEIDPASLADRIRISQPGSKPLRFDVRYDAATRAIEIAPTQPFERFREVTVELLEGIKSVEGGVLKPWALTFTTGQSYGTILNP